MLRKEIKLTDLVLFGTLVLASSVVADAWAAEASTVIGAPVETLALNKALATGNFECRVIAIDPPNGTGVPTGFATIGLRNLLGVVSTGGEILASADLGAGEGLDAVCQALAEQLLGRSSALGCTTGPIRTLESTGQNFTETTRTFDFVCVNAERRVLETIGALFGDVITIPSAARVIQRTGLERRDPTAREQVRIPSQVLQPSRSTNVKP